MGTNGLATALMEQVNALTLAEKQTRELISQAQAESNRLAERRNYITGLIGRADELSTRYLEMIDTVNKCCATVREKRDVLQDARDRLDRAKIEAVLRETPIEKGAPGRINGANAEIRAMQSAQVVDEDISYQNCKAEAEFCQRDLDQAELEQQAALMKVSALKAVTKLYTAELAVIAELE
ncbi:MAG: hypothetical protein M1343_08150 [Chloroflexi bacterium]|nr:hypothetical protein [Chloroflexota bacterium]